MPRLKVMPMALEDVFSDIVRVHLDHRSNSKAGSVIVVIANGRSIRAVARGAPRNDRRGIYLDLASRSKLAVKLGDEIDVTIQRADTLDELLWAWNATDAMPRIAARLGALSVGLGLLGLLLGAIALIK